MALGEFPPLPFLPGKLPRVGSRHEDRRDGRDGRADMKGKMSCSCKVRPARTPEDDCRKRADGLGRAEKKQLFDVVKLEFELKETLCLPAQRGRRVFPLPYRLSASPSALCPDRE